MTSVLGQVVIETSKIIKCSLYVSVLCLVDFGGLVGHHLHSLHNKSQEFNGHVDVIYGVYSTH